MLRAREDEQQKRRQQAKESRSEINFEAQARPASRLLSLYLPPRLSLWNLYGIAQQLPRCAIHFSPRLCFTLQCMQYLQPPLIFSLHRGSEPPAAESCKKAESVGKPESLNFNCTFQALHFQVSALRRSFGRGSVPNTVREVEYQASCFWAHNAVLHPVLAVLLVLATTWPLQKCAVLGTSTVKLTAEVSATSTPTCTRTAEG